MPRSEAHERLGTIDAVCVTNVFGNLTSNAPIQFDHVAGIVSVNTQARRLGCLTFLTGKVAKGSKIESLLLSMPAQEIAVLNENLRLNGYLSGQLTNKASSVEHYLDAAIQLHLLAKQGAIFALTNRGRFLMDVVLPNSVEPYPLSNAAKIYFLDSVLRADFFGIVALLGLLLRGVNSLSALQANYRDALLVVLDRIARSSLDSRLRRIAQDKTISIRNWRKPESYAEHLVPAQVNWLIDLDVIETPINQRYTISAPHRSWLEDALKNVVPSEAEPEDLPAIENVLGQAIMQRVNQHIVFQQPTTEDFRNYLIELFKANRLREPGTSVTYPFSEDAFSLLVEAAVSKTPRFLNKLCDMLLRDLQGMSDGELRLRRDGIPAALIEERLPQTLNLLEEARG